MSLFIIVLVFIGLGVGCNPQEKPTETAQVNQAYTKTITPILTDQVTSTPTIKKTTEIPPHPITSTPKSIPSDLNGILTTNEFTFDFENGERESTSKNFADLGCDVLTGYSRVQDLILCVDGLFQDYFSYSFVTQEVTNLSLPGELDIIQLIDDGQKIFGAKRISFTAFSSPFYVLERDTYAIEAEYNIEGYVGIPAISESGTIAYIIYDGLQQVVIVEGENVFLRLKGDLFGKKNTIQGLSWSPDGTMLAIGVSSIQEAFPPLTGLFVYDITEGQIIAYDQVIGSKQFQSFSRVEDDLNFHIGFPIEIWALDNSMISLATTSNELCILYVNREVLQCDDISNPVKYTTWSPDSQYIAVVSLNNAIRIYEVSTLEKMYEISDHGFVKIIYWKESD